MKKQNQLQNNTLKTKLLLNELFLYSARVAHTDVHICHLNVMCHGNAFYGKQIESC